MKIFNYFAALLIILSTNVCLTSCGDDDEPVPDPKDYPQYKFFYVNGIGYSSITGADVEVARLEDWIIPDDYTGDVVVPSTVTYKGYTYNVKAIGEKAFKNCTKLKSIIIPESVTKIGDNAFEETSLKSVNIGGNVKEIGVEAFIYSPELSTVKISGKVEKIGKRAFARTVLQTLTLGENVKEIGYEAFTYCDRLTTINIPDKVENIGDFAFYGCSGLVNVTIGESIRTIGYKSFASCSNLKDVMCKSVTVPITSSTAFDNTPLKKTLTAPGIALDYYSVQVPWKDFYYFKPILE